MLCHDRHRFDADPYQDPDFHVDADPEPDPDWYKNNPADRRADPSKFLTLEKPIFLLLLYLSHSFASLQCFIFLISVKYVIILSNLNSILKICEKKYSLSTFSYAWN
jgi:hypothetical protein